MTVSNDSSKSLPPAMKQIRELASKAITGIEPAGSPKFATEPRSLMLASRTNAGRCLPDYYLVYFLLVDLLEFPNLGKWEKVAWAVPVRYQGRLYGIEYRKMGLGIFAPNLDSNANRSTSPNKEQEADAREIALIINRGVSAAEPYYEWRAKQTVAGVDLNVVNNNNMLFERYEFFRDRFKTLSTEVELLKSKKEIKNDNLDSISVIIAETNSSYSLNRQAKWNAQAAIEAFFSWTEHIFIHIAILQGKLHSGKDVADMAVADWKSKFKSTLDIHDTETKKYYDSLLGIREQIRNFMAHGAFGKQGEAFRFHSGTGAVPVLLTGQRKHRYSLTGMPAFDESWAISEIENFINHLWSGSRLPARHYLSSTLPIILTYAANGTYSRVMRSEDEMKEFIDELSNQFDNAANMDW